MSDATSTTRPTLVLFVDDEPLVRMLGADVLEEAGFRVVEASDAAQALQALAEQPDIRVLFTDVNMPGDMDGLRLSHRVHEMRPDIRLLIASGQVRPGADEVPAGGQFVPKPWNADDVIARIRTMLDAPPA